MQVLGFLVVLAVLAIAMSIPYDGPWRKAIAGPGTCWMDRSCDRAMTVSHGGDWDIQYPYDSMPAFQRAWQLGADVVKGDFRVSMDNVGVVMHSSPVEFYESLNCFGKYVEKMTAAECQQCRMAISDYYFITVPDMLKWADGLVNAMFCVKREQDIPRAISTLIENKATNRAFLEIGLGPLINLVNNNVPDWDKVYYVIEVSNTNDVQTLLSMDSKVLSRTFLIEFNNWDNWSTDIGSDINLVESKGLRTFAATRDSPITATVEDHLRIFNAGIDVVYTYNLTNAIEARKDVNTKRGIFPAKI